jgi:hypothetical protein
MASTAAPYGFRPVRLVSGRPSGGALNIEQFPIKNGYASVIPYGSPVVLSPPANVGTVTTVSGTGTVATLTFSGAHGLVVGQVITTSGVTPSAFNGAYYIATVPSTTTLTYTYAGGAYASGTCTVNANGGFLTLPTNATFNSLADNYIGVFVGSQYTNSQNGQPQWDQWYPGGVTTTDNSLTGFVVTDPDSVFQVQAHYVQFDALSNIGYSFEMTIPSPAYTTGTKDSLISLDAGIGSDGTSTTNPWKVVGISTDTTNTNAVGYVDVLVKINSGIHIYSRAL